MFQIPQFRCVESEEGVKAADYAKYAIPLDIQDLVAGEDPYKFMDLMKMVVVMKLLVIFIFNIINIYIYLFYYNNPNSTRLCN